MTADTTSIEDLQARERALADEYAALQAAGLTLDLTRGKPSPEQVALADALDDAIDGDFLAGGVDVRNYGGLDGLREAKQLGAALLGTREDETLAGGNASLTLMFQYLANALYHGPQGPGTAWSRTDGRLKFLCVVPGYDRHFAITDHLGFEAVTVPMREDGPDMDEVERLVASDPLIKGVWCVPKYQNPTGYTFSDEVVQRFARLARGAGPHFRIMWDNAYAVHDLYDEPDRLANLMDLCRAEGTEDNVVIFGSTSKITRAGSGISFMATSATNLSHFKTHLGMQTIGPDKVNQLAHVRFLRDLDGINAHMARHAGIVRPKFEAVLAALERELSGVVRWTRPRGGYFISVDVTEGTARETVRLAGEAGLTLTPAGATYPNGRDPNDANIRLAPTYPSLDELRQAMPIFVTAVRLATVRHTLSATT